MKNRKNRDLFGASNHAIAECLAENEALHRKDLRVDYHGLTLYDEYVTMKSHGSVSGMERDGGGER